MTNWAGSSPLARGTREAVKWAARDARFIPARAGNTLSGEPCAHIVAVHPRSRGEHQVIAAVVEQAIGSSPLARGTQGSYTSGVLQERFIPARAGNTKELRSNNRQKAVHPRSRGEHSFISDQLHSSAGSSPLARGTHRVHGVQSY